MERIFFDGWLGLLRTLIIGVLAYVFLVFALRASGKRTLSKMNAFDLVVTVALGSTLATILLSKDVTLAEGALAFALLIGLQFLVTWSSVRVQWVQQIVKGEPSLLLYRGEFLQETLRRERVTEDEVRAAVRSVGLATLGDAEAVVLETDGSLSIIQRGGDSGPSSLADVGVPTGREEAAQRNGGSA
jgi:uncharacterized membrane protein YcaP (DUF421 family)